MKKYKQYKKEDITLKLRQNNLIGHMLRHETMLKTIIEGMLEGNHRRRENKLQNCNIANNMKK